MDDIYIGRGKNSADDNGSENEPQDIYISGNDYGDYFDGEQQGSPSPQRGDGKRKRRKKKTLFKKLFSLLLVVAILFGLATGYTYTVFKTINYNETGHKDNVYLDSSELLHSSRVVNILLIGVDRRAASDESRSDTMLLFTIDKATRTIRLTSFMRDTWVYIPERQTYSKLNAACRYGGAQLVMDTIEYNFNIEIDSYVLADFNMFEDVVDALGGVDVDITESEAVYMRDKVHLENIRSGEEIHLNGNEALWYCRIRYLDSDFMRTERQRKVMTSIISKVKHQNIGTLVKTVKEAMPELETDLTPSKLTRLAVGAAAVFRFYGIEQARVPADGTWSDATKNGQDVLLADLGKNQSFLEDFLYSGV